MARKRLETLVSVFLPWPSPLLSPNTSAHWAVKNKAKQDYKKICAIETYHANRCGHNTIEGKVNVALHFYPPRSGRYDEDNLIARMKAGLDGIAQAIKTDDSQFHLLEPHVHDPVSGGAVIVNLTFLTRARRKAKTIARK